MPDRSSYDAGTPCWVDVSAPDLDQAVDFYTGLFGWTAYRTPDPEAGGYTMFRQDGREVAAAGPAQEGVPPVWSTYIATDDVDAAVRRVAEAGGTVVAEPFDVLAAGRMAVATDPTGATFCLWQAGEHHGATLVNEPVALTWNELNTRDAEAACDFYEAVFGWERERMGDGGAPFTYYLQKLDGRVIGGIMEMGESFGDVPPHWLAYFAVADTDAVVERAGELGGSLVHGPMDTPYGRMAVLSDPAGAVFAVVRNA
jgi:predicted enzyme related to lactoylglutathione lyase